MLQDSPGNGQVPCTGNPFGHTGAEEETTGAVQSAKMVTSQCGRYGHQSMWSLWSPVNVVGITTSQYGLWSLWSPVNMACGRYDHQSIWPVVVMTSSQYIVAKCPAFGGIVPLLYNLSHVPSPPCNVQLITQNACAAAISLIQRHAMHTCGHALTQ